MAQKEYVITEFQAWMADQIAGLNVLQYGGTIDEKLAELARITSDPFARGKGVALTALDGDQVVGVQTYRYWPYESEAERYYSLQSGGTLVHPDARGQGLFTRMLRAGNAILAEKDVDFLTGFPVPMSFGGFIKDGWTQIDSPRWYLRVLRPLRLVAERLQKPATPSPSEGADTSWLDLPGLRRLVGPSGLQLATDPEFLRYRYGGSRARGYVIKRHQRGASVVILIGKIRTSNGFSEFVIGDVLGNATGFLPYYDAFNWLLDELRREGQVSACSILVGNRARGYRRLLSRYGFVPTNKRALFVAKPLSARVTRPLADRRTWSLLFADIDTW